MTVQMQHVLIDKNSKSKQQQQLNMNQPSLRQTSAGNSHHAVTNPLVATIKVRVEYDASTKCKSENSRLNEC